MPVPVRAMVWVRYWSERVSVPVAGPMLCGWKVTASEQVECGLRELPQELTTVKSVVAVCAAMRVRGWSPELVRVIGWGGLEVVSC